MIVSLFAPHRITKGDRAGSVVPGWVPIRWETTWTKFVGVLRETAAISANPAEKSGVTSFSCADFELGANRSKDGVVGCDLIGFDFDDKSGDSPGAWRFDALVEVLDRQGAPYVVHTTASCRDKAHCLRLIMPLDRRVSAIEYPQVWRAFSDWLGAVADEATKDASRLFFEPRLWEGRYNRFYDGHSDRSPIVVDHIVARYAPIIAKRLPITKTQVESMSVSGFADTVVANVTDLDTSPIVSQRALDTAMTSRAGGRMYRFLCSVACTARRQNIALTLGDLINIGHALAQRLGRLDRHDIRHDAANAMNFAERASHAEPRLVSMPMMALPRYW